jgi:hypothetical protein
MLLTQGSTTPKGASGGFEGLERGGDSFPPLKKGGQGGFPYVGGQSKSPLAPLYERGVTAGPFLPVARFWRGCGPFALSPLRVVLKSTVLRDGGLRSASAGSPSGWHSGERGTTRSGLCSGSGTWPSKPPALRSTDTPAPPSDVRRAFRACLMSLDRREKVEKRGQICARLRRIANSIQRSAVSGQQRIWNRTDSD